MLCRITDRWFLMMVCCRMLQMLKVVPFQNKSVKNIKEADLLEVWFDRILDADIPNVLRKIKKPFIYKIEKEGLKNLKAQVIKHASFVDIDVEVDKAIVANVRTLDKNVKIIISYHNFKSTPPKKELLKILNKMDDKKADIFKFATYAKSLSDSIAMLDFLSGLSVEKRKAICICMGNNGVITRIAGHLFGNFCMYFTANEKTKTADGQMTIKEFNKQII